MSIEGKLVCLSGRTSIKGNNEFVWTEVLLSKKKRGRTAYKGHLAKLKKYITAFLNDFESGYLFHSSKAKLFELRINS